MKTLKDKFEENYMAVSVPADNKKGFKIEYIYYRPWHIWNVPAEELRMRKQRVLAASLLSLVVFLLTGSVNAPVTQAAVVVVPAMLALGAHVFELVGAFQFFFSDYRTTEQNYTDINTKLKTAPMVRASLLALTVAACVLNLLKQECSFLSICVAGSFLLQVPIAIYVFRCYRVIPLRTENNDNIKKYASVRVGFTQEQSEE